MSRPAYLIDSDWVAAVLKGRSDAISLLTTLTPAGFVISLVTYGEIYQGIYYGRDQAQHEAGFLEFLRGTNVLPLHQPIMQQFARLRGELRAKGTIITDFDILIASTALYYDLTLVTRNLRHYQRISDLKILSTALRGTGWLDVSLSGPQLL